MAGADPDEGVGEGDASGVVAHDGPHRPAAAVAHPAGRAAEYPRACGALLIGMQLDAGKPRSVIHDAVGEDVSGATASMLL